MQKNLADSTTPQRIRYLLGATIMEEHFRGDETGSRFSLFENHAPSSSRTPIHLHAHEDETFYMIEGEITAVLNAKRFPLRPGDSIFLPRNVPHQLLNESSSAARYLLLCTPGGFENFLAAAGSLLPAGSAPTQPSPHDIQRMREAAPAFGITIMADWPETGELATCK